MIKFIYKLNIKPFHIIGKCRVHFKFQLMQGLEVKIRELAGINKAIQKFLGKTTCQTDALLQTLHWLTTIKMHKTHLNLVFLI